MCDLCSEGTPSWNIRQRGIFLDSLGLSGRITAPGGMFRAFPLPFVGSEGRG